MKDFIENLQTVLEKVQGATDELWQLVGQFSLSLVMRVEDSDDPVQAFKHVRNVHAASLEICNALRSVVQAINARTNFFTETIENFKLDVDRAARRRGIGRLPDELLTYILDRAAASKEMLMNVLDDASDSADEPYEWDSADFQHALKSSVLLSHVCRRFRRTIRLSSVFWSGKSLTSLRPGIFENRPNLTSALPPSIIRGIVERCNGTSALLKAEIQPESYPDSVKAIIDIGTRLYELTITTAEEYRNRVSPVTFPGHCCTPFLRTLNCVFIPHPSLVGNIVYCNLNMCYPLAKLSLKQLLEFLSSARKLERLDVAINGFTDQDAADSFDCISPPSLTMLKFKIYSQHGFAHKYRCLMEKLNPFNVSTLLLHSEWNSDISPLLGFIRAKPSIRRLHLHLESWQRRDINSTVPFVPQHIEMLQLTGKDVATTIDWWLHHPEWFAARNLRLLKLGDCEAVAADILHLRDRLIESGCTQVRLQFEDCDGMEDGIYELADVHQAVP